MPHERNIHQRMLDAIRDTPHIPKRDKKGIAYQILDADDVNGTLRNVFLKHGILPSVSLFSEDWSEHSAPDKNTGEIKFKGFVCRVVVEVVFANIDDPTDCIVVKAPGMGIDTQDKAPGKAFTYATKNAYTKQLMLRTGDDPDLFGDPDDTPPLPTTAEMYARMMSMRDKNKLDKTELNALIFSNTDTDAGSLEGEALLECTEWLEGLTAEDCATKLALIAGREK